MAAELAMVQPRNASTPSSRASADEPEPHADEPDGSYTDRADVIAHTPRRPLAEPELLGTIHYLISDASSFVTGALAVVDGSFDAFSAQ